MSRRGNSLRPDQFTNLTDLLMRRDDPRKGGGVKQTLRPALRFLNTIDGSTEFNQTSGKKMMTQHTKGPWEVEDPMGAEVGLAIVQAGLKSYEWEFIAMVCQSDDGGEDPVDRQRFIHPAEQEANARLIAAAPELLDLVLQYRDDLRRPPSADSTRRRVADIEAILAKITAT